MESEGRGKRSADQLQSAAVQDQAVRSSAGAQGSRIAAKDGHIGTDGQYKVVVRYEDHAVRGFADVSKLGSIEQLLRNESQHPIDTIPLKILDSEDVREVPTKDAKAVFFVKTF